MRTWRIARPRRRSTLELILVGKPEIIEPALTGAAADVRARLSVHAAPSVVGMSEHPREAIRRRKDSSMRLAIDLCVGLLMELELWRAGYRIPVRAAAGEPDHSWLARARSAGCDAVITADRGAAGSANRLGMFSVFIPHGVGGDEMMRLILDGMEELEGVRGTPRPFAMLTPLLAVTALLLAACGGPRPQAVEPALEPAPYCFAATARFDGRDQAASGCFETAALCGNAQRRAVRWGGVAGLREVGACRKR